MKENKELDSRLNLLGNEFYYGMIFLKYVKSLKAEAKVISNMEKNIEEQIRQLKIAKKNELDRIFGIAEIMEHFMENINTNYLGTFDKKVKEIERVFTTKLNAEMRKFKDMTIEQMNDKLTEST